MPDLPGHEGHGHPPNFDPELIEKIMEKVMEAEIIDNLFLVPLLNPARFILTQVDLSGNIQVLGYIPFDFMLDVGIGFIAAVRNAVKQGLPIAHNDHGEPPEGGGGGDEEPPLAGGLFKVI